MLDRISVLLFSPAGGTRRAAMALAQALAYDTEIVDLCQPGLEGRTWQPEEVVLVAGPVYGGRLPSLMVERLAPFCGKGALAVTAVVYGNRAFEDALLELNDCVKAQGFRVAASAALVAEHSMVPSVAHGRPDGQDLEQLHQFAGRILRKLEGEWAEPSVPGQRPYKEWSPMEAVPQVSRDCNRCGLCARQCPNQAISAQDPGKTDASRCFLCMRCVHLCPQNARSLPQPVQAALQQKLGPLEQVRQGNQLFLGE